MELLRDKIKRDTYMVSKLCNMIARGDLRDNHPQQRKSGQWGKETRDNFIVTVIKNEDFDPIKICEQLTEKGIVLWLIDGLQRSTTIENYKAGRFKLGRNINPSVIEYQEAVKVDGIRPEIEIYGDIESGNYWLTEGDIAKIKIRGRFHLPLFLCIKSFLFYRHYSTNCD